MKKIFSILLTLVLALSLCLVTAAPVAAAGGYIVGAPFFTAAGLGEAGWSTDNPYTGAYSAKLWLPAYEAPRVDEARVVFNYEGDLNSITGVSFERFVIGGNNGGYHPYVVLAVDTGVDGEPDAWVVQWVALDFPVYPPLENQWGLIEFNINSPVHVAVTRTGLPDGRYVSYTTEFNDADTLEALKTEPFDGSKTWGDLTVVEVKVMIGDVTGLTEEMTAYVDDITINGVPYEMEPAMAADSDTSEGTGTVGLILSTIDVTAPIAFDFGTFGVGDNELAAAGGNVAITVGNDGALSYSMTAKDADQETKAGFMLQLDNTPLTNELLLSSDGGGSYLPASIGVTYEGGTAGGAFTFDVNQVIDAVDLAGDYTITIEFAGTLGF